MPIIVVGYNIVKYGKHRWIVVGTVRTDELLIASFVLLSLCETIVALTDAVAALITAAAVNALNRAVNISLRARSCRAATAAAADEAFEVVACVLYRCACWLLLFVFCWSVGVIGAENMGSNSNGGVDVDVEISDESLDLLHIFVVDPCGTVNCSATLGSSLVPEFFLQELSLVSHLDKLSNSAFSWDCHKCNGFMLVGGEGVPLDNEELERRDAMGELQFSIGSPLSLNWEKRSACTCKFTALLSVDSIVDGNSAVDLQHKKLNGVTSFGLSYEKFVGIVEY
uniref:Uncharacterized protein n=1 Tax=Glossina austeni TaxID=7395 RepID=A0A1A9UIB8_GLOAU